METKTKDIAKHPCFNPSSKTRYGRVHLPIAPKCNVQCNYCNRKYDCVNESRPGVTSTVLSPWQASEYFKALHQKMPNMAVVGIAGPGDPMANPEETIQTLKLLNQDYPEVLFCLSTNGLNLTPYLDQLSEVGVSHITITMNSLKPETLAKIYGWVRHDKKVYRGLQAGQVMAENQMEALTTSISKGFVTKINTILLPGINEDDIEEVAELAGKLGVEKFNIIPVVPVKDSTFEDIESPTKEKLHEIRQKASAHVPLMTHCARCRADAAGLLGQDIKESLCMLKEASEKKPPVESQRTRVAVASYEGMLVNQHLGEARKLFIFEETRNGYKLLEQRDTPASGQGDLRWAQLARKLNDCRAILAGGAGPKPLKVLKNAGLEVIQMTGLIDTGLDAVYKGTPLRSIKKADAFKCGSECTGNAMGCA